MALPQFSDDLQEEDLEALDAAVNGNRIGAPAALPGKDGKPGRRMRKTPREIRAARAEQKNAARQENAAGGKKVRRVLYISVVPGEQAEVVITEDGQVTEYFVEMAHQVKIRGNIYKGVINNIDTNLQAAFVNFGNGKNGFLQIDEVHPEYYLVPHEEGPGAKYPPIQKALKIGQEILVQVVKEPSGSKGAFLTTWLSIAGRFLVLTPGQEQIGVSRKVTDQAERARLKELIAGIQPGENMGVIIRTASEGASTDSIQQDLQFLKKMYGEILEKAAKEKSPSIIYQEADLASRAVRDYLSESITEIWTDDEATQKRLEETVGIIFPGKDIVKLHKDQRHGMWEHFGILKQLDSVTSREVLLPSGGRLVFDQTEALMAIDINSGKTQGKSSFESMVFRTNMEAAEAIARHLRLRDIGGQVVIDFIEMREKNHCAEVERTLRNAMRRDKASHDIGHMSSFGLLELVRQRTGTSAISISMEPCPHCHGTGLRRNMEWQSLQALRDMEIKMGKLKDGGKGKKGEQRPDHAPFSYECDAELALYVLNHKRDRIIALEEKFGMRIEIRIK
jgi:ribonuclease E